jgi:hypothetical protein
MSECSYCETAKQRICGSYNFNCDGCRERVLLDEPCKLVRKAMAARIVIWGEIPDWQRDPSCGCKNKCRRIQNMEGAQVELAISKQRRYDAY